MAVETEVATVPELALADSDIIGLGRRIIFFFILSWFIFNFLEIMLVLSFSVECALFLLLWCFAVMLKITL